jgi:glutaminyl-tRNA synthetase
MPTIAGLRRLGVTPEASRNFCDLIGVAKVDSRVDIGKLEYCIRDDLNQRVPRVMCVLRPLKVVLLNYPEDQAEELDASYYPRDVPKEGSRRVPFSRVLYIERDDFMEDPPKKFFRLAPGREVRLRYAYLIKCVDVVKDSQTGEVVELHCTYDPDSHGGTAPDGRKVKGTLHWVSAAHALERQGIHRLPESRLGGDTSREPHRAERRERPTGHSVPVRATGILLQRPGGFGAGRARVQPNRVTERHLGQDRRRGIR